MFIMCCLLSRGWGGGGGGLHYTTKIDSYLKLGIYIETKRKPSEIQSEHLFLAIIDTRMGCTETLFNFLNTWHHIRRIEYCSTVRCKILKLSDHYIRE